MQQRLPSWAKWRLGEPSLSHSSHPATRVAAKQLPKQAAACSGCRDLPSWHKQQAGRAGLQHGTARAAALQPSIPVRAVQPSALPCFVGLPPLNQPSTRLFICSDPEAEVKAEGEQNIESVEQATAEETAAAIEAEEEEKVGNNRL